MFPSDKCKVWREFWWNIVAAILISFLVGSGAGAMFPFFFCLIFVFLMGGDKGRLDLTMSNTLARIFVEGDEFNPIDLCWTLCSQFLGAFAGALVYVAIVNEATVVSVNIHGPLQAGEADDRWRALLAFIFLHGVYYQIVRTYGKMKTNSLERNLGNAFAYAAVAVAWQKFATGCIGGANLDFCRLLASKIAKPDATQNFLKDNWWMVLFAPFGGVLQAKLFCWMETMMSCDGSGGCKTSEPKADADAGADNA